MKAEVHDEEVIRPYTPISTNALLGCFDLLIKNYGSQGLLSRYLHEMKVGDYLAFKHIPLNVKIQVPFSQKRVVMIAGGTGITPMIQVLHAILGGDSPDVENVTLLFGNQIHDEILAKNLLEQWADDYSDRFLLVHALSNESNVPNKSSYHRGYIDTDLIRKHVPTIDDDDTLVLVCGPPPMYESLCGPRDDTELTGVLKELGCSAENVYKF
jgi:cytochrome-b5 reductase